MEAEKVLNFYDWVWFRRPIFQKESTFPCSSSSEANPDGENGVKALEEAISTSGSVSPNSVKGFKDVGFVFSEEEEEEEESRISRAYLSEVWEMLALDRRREEISPLLKNWKLPSMRSETDMKQNLRWWAHTVASTVQ